MIKIVGLSYGYRSRCCYAPIRIGYRKVKNTNKKIQVWVCTKCKSKDVPIVEYTGLYHAESSDVLEDKKSFILEE